MRTPRQRYDRSMTTKIAISLPDEQVAAAKQAVKDGRAPSVSALISQALDHRLAEYTMADVVAAFIAEDGEPSAEDVAWAKEALRTTWD